MKKIVVCLAVMGLAYVVSGCGEAKQAPKAEQPKVEAKAEVKPVAAPVAAPAAEEKAPAAAVPTAEATPAAPEAK